MNLNRKSIGLNFRSFDKKLSAIHLAIAKSSENNPKTSYSSLFFKAHSFKLFQLGSMSFLFSLNFENSV